MDSWQSMTNKMLFYAGIQLKLWKHGHAPSIAAFRDASINSMVLAYQSLLAEILSMYKVQVESLPDMENAWALIKQAKVTSSELSYIRQLEQQASSWLNMLQAAHSDSLVPSMKAPNDDANQLILRDVENYPLVNASDGERVFILLKELVNYSRNYSLEW